MLYNRLGPRKDHVVQKCTEGEEMANRKENYIFHSLSPIKYYRVSLSIALLSSIANKNLLLNTILRYLYRKIKLLLRERK